MLYKQVDRQMGGNDFMPKPWQKMVRYRFYLEQSGVDVTSNKQSSSSAVLTAHQLTPSGRVHRFCIGDNGLMFV